MQELKVDSENGVHILEALPESVDVGKYTFVFEVRRLLVHLHSVSLVLVDLYVDGMFS